MNILVTGANGQLGTSLRKSSAASGDRYIFTDVAELDITDAEAVGRTVSDNSVDVIVNFLTLRLPAFSPKLQKKPGPS